MKDFVGFLKLPPTILAGLTIASGLLLFLPDHIISLLYMDNLKEKFGFAIGAVFITSVSILGSYAAVEMGRKIYQKCRYRLIMRSKRKLLKTLEPVEIQIIRDIMAEPSGTLDLPMQHAAVIKLKYHQIISPAGSTHLVLLLPVYNGLKEYYVCTCS